MEQFFNAMPVAAVIGMMVAAAATGVMGGFQYIGDRRWVTKREYRGAVQALQNQLQAHAETQTTLLALTQEMSSRVSTMSDSVTLRLDDVQRALAEHSRTNERIVDLAEDLERSLSRRHRE